MRYHGTVPYELFSRRSMSVILVLATLAGCHAAAGTAGASAPCGALALLRPPPTVEHVVWIWMENRDYEEVISDGDSSPPSPYLTALAHACGLATNYRAIT